MAAAGEAQIAVEFPVGIGGDVGQLMELSLAGGKIGERTLLLGHVFPEQDKAADAAVGLMPGFNGPAVPFDGAIGTQVGIGVAAFAGAGKAAPLDFTRARGAFGQDVVDAAPDDLLIAQAVAVAVGAAGREEAHVAVEHGEAGGCRLDAAPQNLCALGVSGDGATAFRCARSVRLHPNVPESGRRRLS